MGGGRRRPYSGYFDFNGGNKTTSRMLSAGRQQAEVVKVHPVSPPAVETEVSPKKRSSFANFTR